MKIILASSSIYRLALLKQINIEPKIIVPNIDETPLLNENSQQTSQRLAYLKAKKVLDLDMQNNQDNTNIKIEKSIVIGSDQVLLLDNEQLGKPLTHENAIKQLHKTRGKSLIFYTALTMLCGNDRFDACVETKVTMRNYSDEAIEKYLQADKPYNCAGSVKSESLGIILIKEMTSSDPSALVGLPLTKVVDGLEYFKYTNYT